jgi:uncharacterized protein (DUF362 family)
MKNGNGKKWLHKAGCGSMNRRRFLTTTAAAGAGIVAVACNKSLNPLQSGNSGKPPLFKSPVPARPLPAGDPKSTKVTIANVDSYDYDLLKREITAMVDGLGGLGDIIKPGDKVGIKVNMTGGAGSANGYAIPAVESFWTHPTILQVVCELVKDIGAGTIYVVESNYDEESYTDFGYKDVVEYLGVTYINLNTPDPYADFIEAPVGEKWQVYEKLTHNAILHELDCFISLPKAKQHIGAGQTHSMKNLVGTIPLQYYNQGGQGHRAEIHSRGNAKLVRTVLDLNNCRPVHFAVIDAVKTMLGGEGPWQNVKPAVFNVLIAGKDPVAADAIAVQQIGFDPMAPDKSKTFANTDNYLRIAEELGMGVHDVSKIEVLNTTTNTGIRHRRVA